MVCLLLPAAVVFVGCQHTPVAAAPEPQVGRVVGRDELLSSGRPWLLDALRAVRPSFFTGRGQATLLEQRLEPMVVVLDGVVLPDVEALKSTLVSDVVRVRRLGVIETYHRYNRSVSIGALEVVLRK